MTPKFTVRRLGPHGSFVGKWTGGRTGKVHATTAAALETLAIEQAPDEASTVHEAMRRWYSGGRRH